MTNNTEARHQYEIDALKTRVKALEDRFLPPAQTKPDHAFVDCVSVDCRAGHQVACHHTSCWLPREAHE